LPATPSPPEAALPTVTPPQPPVSAPQPVSIQSKELSLMSKLQAPESTTSLLETGLKLISTKHNQIFRICFTHWLTRYSCLEISAYICKLYYKSSLLF
jgi:hypothetical protein